LLDSLLQETGLRRIEIYIISGFRSRTKFGPKLDDKRRNTKYKIYKGHSAFNFFRGQLRW
jgi:hypothetical protein